MGVTGICGMVLFRLGFLLPQGSHPVSLNLKISGPLSVLRCFSAGVMWMWRASLSGSFPGCLALSTTMATSNLMEW